MIDWLLDSDPSIRWQVMRDLLDAPEPDCRAERAKVETEGWGARLLSCQDEDGQWAGGAFAPRGFDFSEWETVGQPWTATTFALTQLREFGFDPASDRARRAVELVGANCDAFDAMTSYRSYRPSVPRVAALAELRRCAGQQFDPAVVEAFIAAVSAGDVGVATAG